MAAMDCLKAIVARPKGYQFVLDWWLRMERVHLTLHQVLFRLDILNLLIAKISAKELTSE